MSDPNRIHGGPAFPLPNAQLHFSDEFFERRSNEDVQRDISEIMARLGGMTLRQYYAANAMRSLVTFALSKRGSGMKPEDVAADAFEYADAMIAFESQPKEAKADDRESGAP